MTGNLVLTWTIHSLTHLSIYDKDKTKIIFWGQVQKQINTLYIMAVRNIIQ